MKLGLLYSFNDSIWFSVEKILNNLLKSYNLIYSEDELVHFDYNFDLEYTDLNELTSKIKKSGIKKLIVIDHLPHPAVLLHRLGKDYLQELDEVIFHIYGDFTLNFSEWFTMDKLLQGVNVKFLCASDKQVRLVSNFVNNKNQIFKLPFPVDEKEFHYKSKDQNFKKKYGMKDEDHLFIYVGRVSMQKRIQELVSTFMKLKSEGHLKESSKLMILGGFDEIGFPFAGIKNAHGEFFRKTMSEIEKFPENLQKSIIFAGRIKNSEIINYINYADTFVSISTYHDEDYGMAVAEALCCGIPSILTDWAGYSSFHLDALDKFTKMVPVSLGKDQIDIDYKKLEDSFIEAEGVQLDSKTKEQNAEIFSNSFGIKAVSKILKDIHEQASESFTGYSPLMVKMSKFDRQEGLTFYAKARKSFKDCYYEVYGPYAE